MTVKEVKKGGKPLQLGGAVVWRPTVKQTGKDGCKATSCGGRVVTVAKHGKCSTQEHQENLSQHRKKEETQER